ncbi:DUF6881 domain-containing protein [Rhizobium sp. BR 362]|uniref:DUF6881 domain-containing protein n=1 Tax=Rhizobium sp. BR 362 TaxID=3040670 RepID=UPI002F42BCD2
MSFSYYRCDWIHPESEEPVIVYYEVGDGGDVPRLIDVFADGHRQCVSIADYTDREREMARIDSLVEGSFYDGVAGLVDGVFIEEGQDRISLTLIGAEKFEVEWRAHRPSPTSRLH